MEMAAAQKKRTWTDEQRQRYNAYQRDYRRRNPDKTHKWQRDYILRKAARLKAEAERSELQVGNVVTNTDTNRANNTFFGYCHLCEEVSEVEGQHVRGMILWQCPCCGAYNEEEDNDGD